MKIAVIAFSATGAGHARTVISGLAQRGYTAAGFLPERFAGLFRMNALPSLAVWTKSAFTLFDALIFVGAAGIAVRAIAPYVDSKTRDPAVICVDELGRFVIPLLSGHIGGANRLSETIAEITGGTLAITTATDINNEFAVDSWAASSGYAIVNPGAIKHVSSAILEGRAVGLSSDFPLATAPPRGVSQHTASDTGICISFDISKKPYANTLNLVPKCIDAGMGCRRGVPLEKLEPALLRALASRHMPIYAVSALASIDLKANEAGLIELAEKHGLEYLTFSKLELGGAGGDFTESAFVESVTGISSVCERAAVCVRGGTLILPKTAGDGITVALAQVDWRVSFDNNGGGRP